MGQGWERSRGLGLDADSRKVVLALAGLLALT